SDVKSSRRKVRGTPTSGGVGLRHSRNPNSKGKFLSMKKIITVIATSLCFAFVAGATDVPKTEVFLGYSFVRLSSNGNIIPSRDLNGGSGQFVYNFWKGLGVAFDAGAVTNNG